MLTGDCRGVAEGCWLTVAFSVMVLFLDAQELISNGRQKAAIIVFDIFFIVFSCSFVILEYIFLFLLFL